MQHVTQPPQGAIAYRDRKRTLWLISLFYPLVALSGIALYATTGFEAALLLPLLIIYGVLALLDWLCGEDHGNPPEECVPQLEADPYYRWLTYLAVPVTAIVLMSLAGFVGTHRLSPLGFLAVALTAGVYSGLGLNASHELGHKTSKTERWLARVAMAVPAYGHFCVEHNRGHHRHVATPDDPASSRMGENIYKFACREIPGACKRAWRLEKERLSRSSKPVWHWQNEILQSYAMTLLLQAGLITAFGWIMLPFLAIHNVFAWWQLTSANYIEHYGLLRRQNDKGVFEHCKPWHSWNADYIASNLLMFHLERHSDHHAHPTRRYQSLRSFADLPTLPSGYLPMFLIAMVPPLWFRVMDRRLLALPQIAGDLSRINIDPARHAALLARYGSDCAVRAKQDFVPQS